MNLPPSYTNMCFGCSPHNQIGLKLQYSLDQDICRATFTAGQQYQGWSGRMHGGLVSTLLDETMAQWLWLNKIWCMTAEMTTRFSLAVPIEVPLTLESTRTGGKGKLHLMEGRLMLPNGQMAARSTGKFLEIKESDLTEEMRA